MEVKLRLTKDFSKDLPQVYLINDIDSGLADLCDSKEELEYVRFHLKEENDPVYVNKFDACRFFLGTPEAPSEEENTEALRRKGHELYQLLSREQLRQVQLRADEGQDNYIQAVAEGLTLSSYRFTKYKSKKPEYSLDEILVSGLKQEDALEELQHRCEGVFTARDLVNEPVIYLTAERLSKKIEEKGKEAGFSVTVMDKAAIEKEQMGGLLAVSYGGNNPPTFNILEHKPKNAVNSYPYILVGKGVVYDTGGLSLKPTSNMEFMKADMGGAASVVGCMEALAKNDSPLWVIGLIPAVENRPGQDAMTPGDVITMHDGSTVEIINTDAEGRLILADALSYAKRYNPELVMDLATLTGSAARAIGKEGMVMMGSCRRDYVERLIMSGYEVHERTVELPLWKEYQEHLKSDIADMRNVGGATAGAIVAGKFLEHFTDFHWIHLDIAGVAFLHQHDSYRGKNGSGAGVRLLYQFLKTLDRQQ